MKDLRIQYKENGEMIQKEYDTIMDFIDEMKSLPENVSILDRKIIQYQFFENSLRIGYDTTFRELLAHCRVIVK